MPKGNPTSQTIASQKYQERVGLISKSYKLKEDVVEEFAAACDAAGVSQAAQLTSMMQDFIKKVKDDSK